MSVDSIKARVSVREVLELLGVRIKNRTACCPLHQDNTPSLSFKDSGLWYCFVCGVGGDVFTLVEKTQRLTFKEAFAWLNDKFSLGLTNEKPKRNFYLEALNENYQILKDCLNQEFYSNCENHYRLMDLSRGMNYPYLFWEANDFTFEYTYDAKQDKIESQLRELENARYRLRRTATQTVAEHS